MEISPLFSGSSGNCIYIGSQHGRILVDAGMSAKAITRELDCIDVDPCSLDGIVITHEHTDHINGAGVMSRRFDIPVYANEGTWKAMSRQMGCIATGNARIFETGSDFYIRDIAVHPFATPHDAAEPVGYALHAGGRKVVVATDLGYFPTRLLDEVAEADIILLESNHDLDMLKNGSYPATLKKRILSRKGHLSNEAAGDALVKMCARNVRRFILGHLSGENNREDIARSSACTALEAEGIKPGSDVTIAVARRDGYSGLYSLE